MIEAFSFGNIVVNGKAYTDDIELIEEKTSKAIKTFNRLFKEGKNVCAGFHLSC